MVGIGVIVMSLGGSKKKGMDTRYLSPRWITRWYVDL